MKSILVTGATGQIGGEVVAALRGAALKGVDAVFLVWVRSLEAAANTIRIAAHAERIVLLSSPDRHAADFSGPPVNAIG